MPLTCHWKSVSPNGVASYIMVQHSSFKGSWDLQRLVVRKDCILSKQGKADFFIISVNLTGRTSGVQDEV